ncbi:three-helix bundle dimerization domain-containing protein [Paractinoplanes hotanensis]|uniref:Uncharacterized protein n=1 Tax=Paractinoplanes hotanensis TaxID=2906497 RepID=A0ABT0YDP7_9ACTN|nr:hypothetical protein [Actinoplanes hotanensis]MCM4084172.1 hypothetical protein [Actinoplanes hotanensis]
MSDETTGESEALAETVHDLTKIFPNVAESVITEHVHQAHTRLHGAPVRDYVPVLMRRQARVTLAALVPIV